jgi:hypothetical protein
MGLQEFLFIGTIFLPAIVLAIMVKLPPLQRLARSSSRARAWTVLLDGLLSWGITFEILLSMAASVIVDIGLFYFNTMLEPLPGMTSELAKTYRLNIILELWARQFIPRVGDVCFNSNPVVCQLADRTMKALTPGHDYSFLIMLAVLAFVPAAVNILISRYLTRSPRQKTSPVSGPDFITSK